MKKSYTIVVEKDPDSGWLVGEVVELPGCYSQAPDLPALERNMREAITAYTQELAEAESNSEFIGTWRLEMPA